MVGGSGPILQQGLNLQTYAVVVQGFYLLWHGIRWFNIETIIPSNMLEEAFFVIFNDVQPKH